MNPAIEIEEKAGPYNAHRTQAKALHGMVAPRAPVHCLQQAHKAHRAAGASTDVTSAFGCGSNVTKAAARSAAT